MNIAAAWTRHRTGLPKPSVATEGQLKAEVVTAKREGCRVVLLTGNYRAQLLQFEGYRKRRRGRWRVISPEDPMSAENELWRAFPEASAPVITRLVSEGFGPLFASVVKSAVKAGVRVIVDKQRPPTLDGVAPHMDELLPYLRTHAGSRPSIVTAELSGESAHELLRALAVFLKNAPDMRKAPLVLVVGIDEAGAERLFVDSHTGPTLRHSYQPTLKFVRLTLPPLTDQRIRRWLGALDPTVASTLLLASGRDDLEAALIWSRWVLRRHIRRRSSGWEFSSSGWVEAADQLELAVETRLTDTARPVARLILHAAALFGGEFSGGAVVRAVRDESGFSERMVQSVFVSLCELGLFKTITDADDQRFAWPDLRFREHVLRDEALSHGALSKRLALRVTEALVEAPDDLRTHRRAAVGLSLLHGDRDALRRVSVGLEGGRDPRLYWSNLLTLRRLGQPSTTLAIELAEAALEARHAGYLRMSAALSAGAAEWLWKMTAMNPPDRLEALALCGRAITHSSETQQSGVDLIQRVLQLADKDARDVLSVHTRMELLHDLGVAQHSLGYDELAIQNLEESRRLQDTLAPSASQYERLAITLHELGKVYTHTARDTSDSQRMATAIQYHRSARTMLLKAYANNPSNEGLLRDAAQCLHSEALARCWTGANESIIRPLLQRAIDELSSLSNMLATPTIQLRLAQLFLELRNSHLRMNETEAAGVASAKGHAHANAAMEMDSAPEYQYMVEHFNRSA